MIDERLSIWRDSRRSLSWKFLVLVLSDFIAYKLQTMAYVLCLYKKGGIAKKIYYIYYHYTANKGWLYAFSKNKSSLWQKRSLTAAPRWCQESQMFCPPYCFGQLQQGCLEKNWFDFLLRTSVQIKVISLGHPTCNSCRSWDLAWNMIFQALFFLESSKMKNEYVL